MSVQSSEAGATPEQPTTPEATTETKPSETVEFWRDKAREQEKRAKANASAAQRLAEIEESQKSEAQKSADALAAAEKARADAESRVLALDIATDFRLGKEDAALVAKLPDEDSMRALAQRLANQADEQKKNGNRVPNEGKQTTPSTAADDGMREFARNLFGTGD